MGRLIGPPINKELQEWILEQHIFFHGTSPLHISGKVNISPKSSKEFRIIDDHTVCWLDYSGSGSETAAHVTENKRLTIMFVALSNTPKIIRLFGYGEIIIPSNLNTSIYSIQLKQLYKNQIIPGHDEYDNGFRCIMILHVNRITHSCGYSIPYYDYIRERPTLKEFSLTKGYEGMIEYRGYKNSYSIDGLPSIGQMLLNSSPSHVEYKEGYYYAKYNGNIFDRIYTKLIMDCLLVYKNIFPITIRDVLLVSSGFSLAMITSYVFTKRINNNLLN